VTQGGFKRKLTAILSADVAGYSRLMGEDEEATVRTITAYREVLTTLIQQHNGKVVDSPGDNLLAEFASVVDAVQCAVAVQKEITARNDELPENSIMQFRIGINLGDVIEEEERIYGDGVNIAARLEALANPGGICISKTTFDQIESKLPYGYEFLGDHTVKNIAKPVGAYRVLMEPRVTVAGEKVKAPKAPLWRHKTVLVGALILIVTIIGVGVWSTYFRATSIEQASGEKMILPLPEKPSIAVLPFTNMSGDPEQEYFSDGLTDDLITALSQYRGLFVISRNSVFTYKGQAVKSEQVRKELGVRYMLEGSVRKAGKRVRITAQLIETTTGGHQWAERYDRELKDIFTLQDEITQQIVSALDVKFEQIEQERALRKDTANLNAFDYNWRGWWYYQRFTKEDNEQARRMFEKAIELEPKFAHAYAGLGFTFYEQWASQWSQDPQSLERAFELAKKAIAFDDSRSTAYTLLSHVYLWRKQHAQAIAEQERAIALNPNDADGYADLAETLVWAGKPSEALGLVEKAMRLNPHYPVDYLVILGFAYSMMERYEEAKAELKRALTRSPDHYGIHLMLAIIYSEIGREEEARAHVGEALRVNPQLSLEDLRQRLPAALPEHVIDALRKAGLPD
jgi:adenylate cyclase